MAGGLTEERVNSTLATISPNEDLTKEAHKMLSKWGEDDSSMSLTSEDISLFCCLSVLKMETSGRVTKKLFKFWAGKVSATFYVKEEYHAISKDRVTEDVMDSIPEAGLRTNKKCASSNFHQRRFEAFRQASNCSTTTYSIAR